MHKPLSQKGKLVVTSVVIAGLVWHVPSLALGANDQSLPAEGKSDSFLSLLLKDLLAPFRIPAPNAAALVEAPIPAADVPVVPIPVHQRAQPAFVPPPRLAIQLGTQTKKKTVPSSAPAPAASPVFPPLAKNPVSSETAALSGRLTDIDARLTAQIAALTVELRKQEAVPVPQTTYFSTPSAYALAASISQNSTEIRQVLDTSHITNSTISNSSITGSSVDATMLSASGNTALATTSVSTLTASGDVTARAFYGDGSHLAGVPSVASTTAWNNFLKTPSSVITAGTGLAWSGNILNAAPVCFNNLSAVAMGNQNIANGMQSSSVGVSNCTSGLSSSAFGTQNNVTGDFSTASGFYNIVSNFSNSAIGICNCVSGMESSAIGYSNCASGIQGFAGGYANVTNGNQNTAVGFGNTASDFYSAAFGHGNHAGGYNTFAIGSNIQNSNYSSVEIGPDNGNKIQISSSGVNFVSSNGCGFCVNGTPVVYGGGGSGSAYANNICTAGGYLMVGACNYGYGFQTSTFGFNNYVSGSYASAFGIGNTSSGCYSSALGSYNSAGGYHSLASGFCNISSGDCSYSLGGTNSASGYSTAVGIGNCACGGGASSLGFGNASYNNYSTASGYRNTACNQGSSAFGVLNNAVGISSSAFGYGNTAFGSDSFAGGYGNTASGYYSTALGSRNSVSADNASAFGSGLNNSTCSSAMFGYGNTNLLISSVGGYAGSYAGGSSFTFNGQADGSLNLVGGVLTSYSDERLKNIQGNFTDGLSQIENIDPILYKWKPTTPQGKASQTTYAGFSAQNVLASIPEAVSLGSDGFYSLNDRPILAASVNAIKSLATQNASTTAFLQNLSLRVDSILSVSTSTSTSSSTTASSTAPVTGASSIAAVLQSLGADIQNGIAHFASILVDSMTAKNIVANTLSADSLTVGSAAKPSAINIFDKNGQPGCITIDDVRTGVLRVSAGTCEVPVPIPPAVSDSSPASSTPLSTPSGDVSSTSTSTPSAPTPSVSSASSTDSSIASSTPVVPDITASSSSPDSVSVPVISTISATPDASSTPAS